MVLLSFYEIHNHLLQSVTSSVLSPMENDFVHICWKVFWLSIYAYVALYKLLLVVRLIIVD
jgi:hypothetical protein